jgi:hypothetical protein
MLREMIVRYALSQVLPHILLCLPPWRAGWQPLNPNPACVLVQPSANGFCLVRPVVVDTENDLALRMSGQIITRT